MSTGRAALKKHLKAFDFRKLFIEELGWDNTQINNSKVNVESGNFEVIPIAEKRGMVAFCCKRENHGHLANSSERRHIEKQIAKVAHEHIIIYSDDQNSVQVWQWIRRTPGKPLATREHRFVTHHDGEALAQKLQSLAFKIEEEDNLNIAKVADRARQAFDVDKVTKKFYARFKSEHDIFLDFVKGIKSVSDKEWYTSLMINRLMFVYFIQKKGFLDGDPLYLQNRMKRMKDLKGKNKFHSFYSHFLLRLFHEGLGSPDRNSELDFLLGRVPYLNGGLFDVHELERQNSEIQISDQAFERLFSFFENYEWHLDDRVIGSDKEINPDVLGYIFENYINQKQMGAYYTKEDITEYISRNCLFPYILDNAAREYESYFGVKGQIWSLIKERPDRYIYPMVSAGKSSDLKKAPRDSKSLNSISDAKGSLKTETWREFVSRRKYHDQLYKLVGSGSVNNIDDLIKYNLNLPQFFQDIIESCNDIKAFGVIFALISKVTVLDPTCGSGAFVFSALNLLEPVYDACIEKMRILYSEASSDDRKKYKKELAIFKDLIEALNRHPNQNFFIVKSIILNNLYGVDIMREAVEVCKLRLFLKLAAQVSRIEDVEPLPDIDFNFRSGNTLIGVLSSEELGDSKAGSGKQLRLNQENTKKILEIAEGIESEYLEFKSLQVDHNVNVGGISKAKRSLEKKLASAQEKLDLLVAGEYGISPKEKKFEEWREAHQPFHWISAFHGIMQAGGFDVIIGNPPYIEWSKIKDYTVLSDSYETQVCGNVYATMCERSYSLLNPTGRFGMIVPLSCVATERMEELRDVWGNEKLNTFVSHYSGDAHPAVLFEGVKFRLSILLQNRSEEPKFFSTHFQRWYSEARETLFPLINYTHVEPETIRLGLPPKVGGDHHMNILKKLIQQKSSLSSAIMKNSEFPVYSHRIVAHFVKAFDFVPFFKNDRDGEKKSEDYKIYAAKNAKEQQALCALLNSTLFYIWFVTYSDVYHCGRELILDFPCDLEKLTEAFGADLKSKNKKLMSSLKENCVRRKIPYKHTGLVQYDEFYPRQSKLEIDSIDETLGKFFGLSDSEIDYVLNFDFKFRMGE